MSKFEFTGVFISLIIAFSVTELLAGVGRLMRERRRVEFYSVHGLVIVLVLGLLANNWWGLWSYRDLEFERMTTLLVLLAPAITYALLAFQIVPSIPPSGTIDLRSYYYENSKLFYSLAALAMVEISMGRILLGSLPLLHVENWIRAGGFCISMCLALSSNPRLHGVLVGVQCTLLIAFIVTK